MHEYYIRRKISIKNTDGHTASLSSLIDRADCPLSKGIKNNLKSIKKIRDKVEHDIFGGSDIHWLPLFQACCLNYDISIRNMFGERLSLRNDLSAALHFGKLDIEQISTLQSFDIPQHIKSFDAGLRDDLSTEELEDIEYQFRVVYTFDSASKGSSHIQFVSPDSDEGKQIHNVLQKFKIADELYKYKPKDVVKIVRKTIHTFTLTDHTNAWKRYKVRPPASSDSPGKTNRKYCIYHPAHKDYTYNDAWISLIIDK